MRHRQIGKELNKDKNIHKSEALKRQNKRTLTLELLYISYKKKFVKKVEHHVSRNDYRVATLSKSYLIVIGFIMQSLKSI